MSGQRLNPKYKKRIRNLKQYRDMTDEEFDTAFENLVDDNPVVNFPRRSIPEMEKLIDEKLNDFTQDYDLSDMKINDRLVLRNLIRSIISLEDLENVFVTLRENFDKDSVLIMDRVANVMSRLRSDILCQD